MIILDTGVLYGAADTDDDDHEACLDLLSSPPGPLVIPLPVVIETAYMIQSRLGAEAEARFLASVADGEYVALRDLAWGASNLVTRA